MISLGRQNRRLPVIDLSSASTVLEEIFNGQLIMESTRLQAFRQARRDMYYRRKSSTIEATVPC